MFKEDVILECSILRGFVRTEMAAEESLVAALKLLMLPQVSLVKVSFVTAGTLEPFLTTHSH